MLSVLGKIYDAEITTVPWPHLIVNDIFPRKVYNNILENLPNRESMDLFSAHRYLYWINKGKVQMEVPSFWKELREELFNSLWVSLEEKFGVKGYSIGAELLYDLPGYNIGPHTDTPDKLITGLFYLPKTDANFEHGTILYHCDTPDPRGKGHKLTSEYKQITVVPYIPNTALFFLRSDVSFHGVKPTPVERRILAFDVFK